MRPQRKTGSVPPGRIGVFDAAGRCHGHVGPSVAASSTIARFGVANAKLVQRNGKLRWEGQPAPVRRQSESFARKHARGSVRVS